MPSGMDQRPVGDDEARALAESAAALFAEGKVDEAGALFARALTPGTTDLRVLFLGFQFHFRSGRYDEAERLVRRRLALAAQDSEDQARACTNLGLVLLYQKKLDSAELEFTRSVEISERIADQLSLARGLANLALVPEARAKYDRAEALYRRAMAIAQRIGADKIFAGTLANLGDIAVARSRPDDARPLWTRAIEIFDRLGHRTHSAEFTAKLRALDTPSAKPG